ncbi:MAG: hypothetical protein ACI38Q_04785 [Candidatus Bruticola sp.]
MGTDKKTDLFVVGRDSVVEARRMLGYCDEADIFLVGRGLLLPAAMFPKRKIYALREEAEAMGIGNKSGEGLYLVSAAEMVDILLEHRVYNFS